MHFAEEISDESEADIDTDETDESSDEETSEDDYEEEESSELLLLEKEEKLDVTDDGDVITLRTPSHGLSIPSGTSKIFII